MQSSKSLFTSGPKNYETCPEANKNPRDSKSATRKKVKDSLGADENSRHPDIHPLRPPHCPSLLPSSGSARRRRCSRFCSSSACCNDAKTLHTSPSSVLVFLDPNNHPCNAFLTGPSISVRQCHKSAMPSPAAILAMSQRRW